MERPEFVTDQMLEFMDDIRDDGQINPLGAGKDLEIEFSISNYEASEVIKYWMHSYRERHIG